MNDVGNGKRAAEQWLGWAAALCWLAAWLLPVVDGYPGWAAFRAALSGPFRDTLPVGGEEAVPQVLSALTNVVFAVLFAMWLRAPLERPAMWLKVAVACLILDCYWWVQLLRAGEVSSLLFGYYVWLAAFALLVAVGILSVVSTRRTSRTPTAGRPA
jgi:hypothetical protein